MQRNIKGVKMNRRNEIKKEMFKIIDRYVMNNNPKLDFSDEDREKLKSLQSELQKINEEDQKNIQ